jgi:hypothetical protein
MKDLIAPFRWHLCLRWRTRVGHHRYDFGAKTLLIEPKRRLALTVEDEIGIQMHGALLWRVKMGTTPMASYQPVL